MLPQINISNKRINQISPAMRKRNMGSAVRSPKQLILKQNDNFSPNSGGKAEIFNIDVDGVDTDGEGTVANLIKSQQSASRESSQGPNSFTVMKNGQLSM